MEEASACLGEDDLLSLAAGQLSGLVRERAEAHIDGCRACRMLLSVAANSGHMTEGSGRGQDLGVFRPDDVVAGRYQIVRLLGRGGMGEVYEAVDATLAERVALKTIGAETPLDQQGIDRLKAEVQMARRVTHANVCRVFDVGFHETRTLTAGGEHLTIPFLTMELLAGETLRLAVNRAPFEAPRALEILTQMADALDAAHAAGVVHTDLKSDNVMLVPGEGGAVRAVITDFGLARRYRPGSLSARGQEWLGGTIGYMAPEHLDGRRPGPAGDIYSLGVVLYEMLTGALPYAGGAPLAAAIASTREAPPSLRERVGAPEWWDAVIRKSLDVRPERRFHRAAEMVAALRAPVGSRRYRAPLVAAGLLGLASLVTVGYRSLRAGEATRRPVVAASAPVTPRPPARPIVEPTPPPPAAAAPRALDRTALEHPVAKHRPRKQAARPQPGSVPAPRRSNVEEPGDDDAIDPF